MKNISLSLLSLCLFFHCITQADYFVKNMWWWWIAFSWDSVTTDSWWNVYITWEFTWSWSLFWLNVKSQNDDVFVAKFNWNWEIQWVQTWWWYAADISNAVTVDNNWNVYITWDYAGTWTFWWLSVIANWNYDFYLAKYNSSWIIQWLKTWGWTANEYWNWLATDNNWNVYAVWTHSGTGSYWWLNLALYWNSDIFVVKYNSSWDIQWIQQGWWTAADNWYSIATDSSWNCYITGSYSSTWTFWWLSQSTYWSTDSFLVKYSTTWNAIWFQRLWWTNADEWRWIATDSSWKIYITWSFNWTWTFGWFTVVSKGSYDIYTAKYNDSWTAEWVQAWWWTGSDTARWISVSSNWSVYVTWYFPIQPATFSWITITSNWWIDTFLLKYSSWWTLQYAQNWWWTSWDNWYSVASDSSWNAYIIWALWGSASYFWWINLSRPYASDIFSSNITIHELQSGAKDEKHQQTQIKHTQ